MGPKRFYSQNFSQFLVKFKKLRFIARLRQYCIFYTITKNIVLLTLDFDLVLSISCARMRKVRVTLMFSEADVSMIGMKLLFFPPAVVTNA